jgi:alpha-galactosidase
MYVSKDKEHAVVFTYSLHDILNPVNPPVQFDGLDPDKNYLVKEINLLPGKKSHCPESGHVYSGSYLMQVGVHAPIGGRAQSAVFELTVK